MQATITNGIVTLLGEGPDDVPDWVQIGATLNECNLWQNPEVIYTTGSLPTTAPVVLRHITQLAFLNRFTDAEAVAIDLASQGATPQAAAMRRYQSKVSAASYIDLDREDTRSGVNALESAGLLGSGRASEILDSDVQPYEKYHG